jgi:hypothetical protein
LWLLVAVLEEVLLLSATAVAAEDLGIAIIIL